MMTVLIIDDVKEDAFKMKEALAPLLTEFQFSLKYIANIHDALLFLKTHSVDLVLLDLEFTTQNITAASLLNDFPVNLPIIIVSNLVHFQKPLSLKVNVKGFVPKSQLHHLPNIVSEVLYPPTQSIHSPRVFVFPPATQSQMPEGIRIIDIRFIDFYNRNTYQIHLTNGFVKELTSLPFKQICKLIQSQKIGCLQQISRNEIINTDYMSTISKLENGRIEITLVNMPSRKFYVGRKHKDKFEIYF